MGSRWKNKGQGGGVSWDNKDKKIAQQSKKKQQKPVSAAAAAAGQTAKANAAAAQPTATRALPSAAGLAEIEDGAAQKLWRVRQAGDAKRLRVLCLHGYTQNGSVLKRKLLGLEKHVQERCPGAVFTYPTGPHEAKEEWVEALDEAEAALAGPAAQSRAWWSKSPRQESGGEETYAGWAQSVELLAEIRQRSGPFDAVLGFSQGAAVAALLAVAWGVPRCITAGGYVARGHPLAAELERGEHSTRTLHAAGAKDTLVTETASQELASLFQDSQLFRHDGGHGVPGSAEFRDAVVELLLAEAAAAPKTPVDSAETEAQAAREARAAQLAAPAPGTPRAAPSVPMLVAAEEDSEAADEIEALQAIFMDVSPAAACVSHLATRVV